MIDMKCPSCSAGGRIPREKINTRLVCKKCLRVFHVTPSGNTVLGEPSVTREAAAAAHPQQQRESASPRHGRHQHDAVERFDDVASRLSQVRLPQISPIWIGAVLGIALLGGIGYFLFSKQTVEARAQIVARSIQKTDMKQVIDLAFPGTEMDVIRWYNDAFKQYNDLKMALAAQDPGITIEPPVTAGDETKTNVVFSKQGLRFDGSIFNDALQPNPSFAKAKQTLELPLFWMKDMWGNWCIDGTRTYAGH